MWVLSWSIAIRTAVPIAASARGWFRAERGRHQARQAATYDARPAGAPRGSAGAEEGGQAGTRERRLLPGRHDREHRGRLGREGESLPTHSSFIGYKEDLAFDVVVEGDGAGAKVAAPARFRNAR